MADDFEGSESLLGRTRDFVGEHRDLYLSSGGRHGHIVDMSHAGVARLVPTLLLETVGRKSGRRVVAPLIYGYWQGEWVIVASKGGAPDHPAWYLNLQDMADAVFQVGPQAFRAHAREPEGQERAAVWAYMEGVFPQYAVYQQSAGGRTIPLVMLKPVADAPPLGG